MNPRFTFSKLTAGVVLCAFSSSVIPTSALAGTTNPSGRGTPEVIHMDQWYFKRVYREMYERYQVHASMTFDELKSEFNARIDERERLLKQPSPDHGAQVRVARSLEEARKLVAKAHSADELLDAEAQAIGQFYVRHGLETAQVESIKKVASRKLATDRDESEFRGAVLLGGLILVVFMPVYFLLKILTLGQIDFWW